MNDDILFSRLCLNGAREDARRLRVKVPKRLSAIRCGVGDWWLVESRDGYRKEVCASNAYEARFKVISSLLPEEPEEAPSVPRATNKHLAAPVIQ